MPETEPLSFRATLPATMSAVKVGGDLAVRLQLDVPASDYDRVLDFVRQAVGRAVRLVVVWEEVRGA